MNLSVEIPEGKSILIKVADIELTVKGTGHYDDSYSINLSNLTVEQRNAIKEILIFAEPGVAGVSGEFKIHWMSFN